MTWLLTICGVLAFLALVALVTYAVSLRRQIRRDMYCKLTCVGGSEMGTCPCRSPKECRVIAGEEGGVVTTTLIPCHRTREAIASRFRAGESVAELVYDYDHPTEAIEAAIREEMQSCSRAEILNSNILALIELLTYDGARTRGEGSVLVGEKLDEYRERTAK